MTRKEMTEQFDLFDSLIAAPEKLFTDDIERNIFKFVDTCRTDDGKSLGDKAIEYLKTIPCFSMCYLSWSSKCKYKGDQHRSGALNYAFCCFLCLHRLNLLKSAIKDRTVRTLLRLPLRLSRTAIF